MDTGGKQTIGDFNKFKENAFKREYNARHQHKCPICKQYINEYQIKREDVKEYLISGLCYNCQIKIFKQD